MVYVHCCKFKTFCTKLVMKDKSDKPPSIRSSQLVEFYSAGRKTQASRNCPHHVILGKKVLPFVVSSFNKKLTWFYGLALNCGYLCPNSWGTGGITGGAMCGTPLSTTVTASWETAWWWWWWTGNFGPTGRWWPWWPSSKPWPWCPSTKPWPWWPPWKPWPWPWSKSGPIGPGAGAHPTPWFQTHGLSDNGTKVGCCYQWGPLTK